MCVQEYVYIYICTCKQACIRICPFSCVYVRVNVYGYLHVYTHTHQGVTDTLQDSDYLPAGCHTHRWAHPQKKEKVHTQISREFRAHTDSYLLRETQRGGVISYGQMSHQEMSHEKSSREFCAQQDLDLHDSYARHDSDVCICVT